MKTREHIEPQNAFSPAADHENESELESGHSGNATVQAKIDIGQSDLFKQDIKEDKDLVEEVLLAQAVPEQIESDQENQVAKKSNPKESNQESSALSQSQLVAQSSRVLADSKTTSTHKKEKKEEEDLESETTEEIYLMASAAQDPPEDNSNEDSNDDAGDNNGPDDMSNRSQLHKNKEAKGVVQRQESRFKSLERPSESEINLTLDDIGIPSDINIHPDASSATDLNAKAYTQGKDIYFAPGELDVTSRSGLELLGHEIEHALHHQNESLQGDTIVNGIDINTDPKLEAEADAYGSKFAEQILSAGSAQITGQSNSSVSTGAVAQRNVTDTAQRDGDGDDRSALQILQDLVEGAIALRDAVMEMNVDPTEVPAIATDKEGGQVQPPESGLEDIQFPTRSDSPTPMITGSPREHAEVTGTPPKVRPLDNRVDYYMKVNWDSGEFYEATERYNVWPDQAGTALDNVLPPGMPAPVRGAANVVFNVIMGLTDMTFASALALVPVIGGIADVFYALKDGIVNIAKTPQIDGWTDDTIRVLEGLRTGLNTAVGVINLVEQLITYGGLIAKAIASIGGAIGGAAASAPTGGAAAPATAPAGAAAGSGLTQLPEWALNVIFNIPRMAAYGVMGVIDTAITVLSVVARDEALNAGNLDAANAFGEMAQSKALTAYVDALQFGISGLDCIVGGLVPGFLTDQMAETTIKGGQKFMQAFKAVNIPNMTNTGGKGWLSLDGFSETWNDWMIYFNVGDVARGTDPMINPSGVAGQGNAAGIIRDARSHTQQDYLDSWEALQADDPEWSQDIINKIISSDGFDLQDIMTWEWANKLTMPSGWIELSLIVVGNLGQELTGQLISFSGTSIAQGARVIAPIFEDMINYMIDFIADNVNIEDSLLEVSEMIENQRSIMEHTREAIITFEEGLDSVVDLLQNTDALTEALDDQIAGLDLLKIDASTIDLPAVVPISLIDAILTPYNSSIDHIKDNLTTLRDDIAAGYKGFLKDVEARIKFEIKRFSKAIEKGGEVERIMLQAEQQVKEAVTSFLELTADFLSGEYQADFSAFITWLDTLEANAQSMTQPARLKEFSEFIAREAQPYVDDWKERHTRHVNLLFYPPMPAVEVQGAQISHQLLQSKIAAVMATGEQDQINAIQPEVATLSEVYEQIASLISTEGRDNIVNFWQQLDRIARITIPDVSGQPAPGKDPAPTPDPKKDDPTPTPDRPIEQEPTMHTVVLGDNLWNLARHYYGNPRRWQVIYDANTAIIDDPHWIYPGQQLLIPDQNDLQNGAGNSQTSFDQRNANGIVQRDIYEKNNPEAHAQEDLSAIQRNTEAEEKETSVSAGFARNSDSHDHVPAFAQGTDIHFAPGQFKPDTVEGQQLIGHELKHVEQQAEGRVPVTSQMKGENINTDPSLEAEADRAGEAFAAGGAKLKPDNTAVSIKSQTSQFKESKRDTLVVQRQVIQLSGEEEQMVRDLIKQGQRNENILTNHVYYTRYPEDRGRRLIYPSQDREEQAKVREWITIRDTIVRPILSSSHASANPDSSVNEHPDNKEGNTGTDLNNQDRSNNDEGSEGAEGRENSNIGVRGEAVFENGGGHEQEGEHQNDPQVVGGKQKNNPEAGNLQSGGDRQTGKRANVVAGGAEDGFDWVGTGGNILRTVAEVMRLLGPVTMGPIPIPIGPTAGLAAGGINAIQDLKSSYDAGSVMLGLMTGSRNVLNIGNGLIGDLNYCVQALQNVATASVVGAELDAVLVPIGEVLTLMNVVGGAAVLINDTLVMSYATAGVYYYSEVVLDNDAKNTFEEVALGYAANGIADTLSVALDLWDTATLSFGQGELADKAVRAVSLIGKSMDDIGPVLLTMGRVFERVSKKDILLKIVKDIGIGVWGGSPLVLIDDAIDGGSNSSQISNHEVVSPKMVEGSNPIDIGREASAQWLQLHIDGAKNLFDTVGDGVEDMAETLHDAMELANEYAKNWTEGEEPFEYVKRHALQEIQDMEGSLAGLRQCQGFSGTIIENLQSMMVKLDEIESPIDGLEVPELQIPEADVGDNAFADLAEDLINSGGEVAQSGISLIREQIQSVLNQLKSAAREAIASIKRELDFLRFWAELFRDNVNEQLLFLEHFIRDMREKLDRCDSVEDLFNLALEEISRLIGLDESITIDDIVQGWYDMRSAVDQIHLEVSTWISENVGGESAPAQHKLENNTLQRAEEDVFDVRNDKGVVQQWPDIPNPIDWAADKWDDYKQDHYKRNQHNYAPAKEPVDDPNWLLLPDSKSVYHQHGEEGRNNRKYVSADGHYEAVYDEDGNLVTDDENLGTYNFTGPEDAFGHWKDDVLPYWLFGNSKDDDTGLGGRLVGPRVEERIWDGLFGEDEEPVQEKNELVNDFSSNQAPAPIPAFVNIHTDSSRATALGAAAFAQGTDIHFAPGQFKPDTVEGQKLIGHELKHVEQQAEGRVPVTTQMKGENINTDPSLEAEADRAGEAFARKGLDSFSNIASAQQWSSDSEYENAENSLDFRKVHQAKSKSDIE